MESPIAVTRSQPADWTANQNVSSVPGTNPQRSAIVLPLANPAANSWSHHSQNSHNASATHLRSLPVALAMSNTSCLRLSPFCRGIQSPAMIRVPARSLLILRKRRRAYPDGPAVLDVGDRASGGLFQA